MAVVIIMADMVTMAAVATTADMAGIGEDGRLFGAG
jgi:hypothetical protein